MISVDSRPTNRLISTSKRRQIFLSMVILGLLLIFTAEYDLLIHNERIRINYDGPSGSGYDEIIVGLPVWVYPTMLIGLTISIIGCLASITLLNTNLTSFH